MTHITQSVRNGGNRKPQNYQFHAFNQTAFNSMNPLYCFVHGILRAVGERDGQELCPQAAQSTTEETDILPNI